MLKIKLETSKYKECNLCGKRFGVRIVEVKKEGGFFVLSICEDCVEFIDLFLRDN